MTRTLTRASVFLVLALLLVPACATTDRNAVALTVCLAGITADVALSVHDGPTWAPGGLLGVLERMRENGGLQ